MHGLGRDPFPAVASDVGAITTKPAGPVADGETGVDPPSSLTRRPVSLLRALSRGFIRDPSMVDQLRQRRRTADAAGLPATSHREAPTDAKPRHSPRARPRTAAVVLGSLLFYASALAAVSHWHQWLPRPLGVDAPAARFSEGRARLVLGEIMRLGYRPVGSRANEELVPAYLLAEIEAIKAAAGDDVALEIDVQRPSGAFGLDFMAQFQNIYANVTNVLVRVSAKGVPIEHSLLISSHYDAAIGGAAGSDDGVNVAIMIELLRLAVLSPPKHAALVFNFNGAEETIMQAAHGFITSHPWTETIRAFINLEAAGAGGRELLFQTGSDELALAYAHGAKYPHGSIIGQELFQSGVLPAETDYRVYRDFGEVAGMDFAYIANGYVYHTHLDDESRIQPGAIQRLGDNLVGVIEHLANRPGKLEAIAATPHSSNTLFFDVAGIFMVTASKTTTFAVSGLVLAFAVLYFVLLSPVSLMERVQALTLQFKCAGAALGAALAVSVLMTLFAPLAWYSTPVLAAALYVSPAVAGMLHCLSTFVSKRSKSSSGTADALSVPSTTQWRLEESMFDAVLLLWSVLLAVMLSVGLMSSYLLAIWIAFPLLGQCVSGALRSVGSLSPSIYLAVSFASLAAPVVLTMFTFALAVIFLLPLMGRAGSQVPSDIVVAVLFWAMLTVLLSFAGRLFCFVSPKQLRSLRNTFVLITLAAIAFASVRNPYTDECPKRVMVQHVYREVTLPSGEVKTDSGLWVNPLDFRGLEPMRPFLSGTQWHETQLAPTALREEFRIYGDLPWSLPVKSMLPAEKSWYLTTAPPVLPPDQPEARLEVLSSTYSSETDRRKIHLRFSGPSHMNLFIDAKATRLTSWSIGNGTHGPVPEADDAYILQLCSGTPPANFHFWLEAESARPIDVVFVGHYIEVVTPEMAEFMGAMPSWFAFMSCASTLSSMQI